MNKPKIPRETTLVTVGISCSQWGSLLQGGQNTSYKVDATELFFLFFRNKSGTFVKSSSLPSRRSFRHAIFPSIPWRGKGDCVTGQKRLPSRVTRTSRSRALGESLLSVFQGWYINFILFYFIFKFFFFYLFIFCSQLAARSSQLALFQLACSPHPTEHSTQRKSEDFNSCTQTFLWKFYNSQTGEKIQ